MDLKFWMFAGTFSVSWRVGRGKAQRAKTWAIRKHACLIENESFSLFGIVAWELRCSCTDGPFLWGDVLWGSQ